MRRHFESIRFQSGASKVGACDGQSVANWNGTSGKWTHTVHRSGRRTPNLGIPVIYGAGGCQANIGRHEGSYHKRPAEEVGRYSATLMRYSCRLVRHYRQVEHGLRFGHIRPFLRRRSRTTRFRGNVGAVIWQPSTRLDIPITQSRSS